MQIEKIPEKIDEEDEKDVRIRPVSSSQRSDTNLQIPSKGIYLDQEVAPLEDSVGLRSNVQLPHDEML